MIIYYYYPVVNTYTTKFINPGHTSYLEVTPNAHNLALAVTSSNSSAHNLPIHIEIIDYDLYHSSDIALMPVITTEITDDSVYASRYIGSVYYQFTIMEKSYVKAESFTLEDMSKMAFGFNILNSDLPYVKITYGGGSVLEPGTYVVQFYSDWLRVGYARLVIEPYLEEHITIELPISPTIESVSEYRREITTLHYDGNDNDYIHFTLDQSELVYINAYSAILTNAAGEVVGIFTDDPFANTQLLNLVQGDYVLKISPRTDATIFTKTTWLSILSSEEMNDDLTHGSEFTQIVTGDYVFTKNHNYDQEWVSFTLTDESTITILTRLGIDIYDEDGNVAKLLYGSSKNHVFTLTPGNYFLGMTDYSSLTTWTLSFSMVAIE